MKSCKNSARDNTKAMEFLFVYQRSAKQECVYAADDADIALRSSSISASRNARATSSRETWLRRN